MTESKNPIKVILVDDSEDDVLMMTEALRDSPPLKLTRVYGNGRDTLHFLKNNLHDDDFPNILLLDINMPKMNGFDVLSSLKEHAVLRQLPVILLTTSNRHEDVTMAYELGANSYIQKPFEYETLVETMQKLADYWSHILLPTLA
ncbi:MAG: response regulator [Verrucomicrobiota bacterium]